MGRQQRYDPGVRRLLAVWEGDRRGKVFGAIQVEIKFRYFVRFR